MWIAASGARRRFLVATLAALATLTTGVMVEDGVARGEESVLAQLRIEGPKGNLDPGTWYVTGSERVKRSRGLDCKHRKGTIEVPGATALGVTETASDASSELPAARVRRDDFGLFLCELGGLVGRPFDHPDGFSGWIYWIDFAAGTQAAENETLSGGEQVLWVFSDFGERDLNTGNALELTGVPPYDQEGTFTVQVLSHAFDGSPTPLAGAKIKGAESFDDLGGGSYEVTVPEGRTTLYAKRKPDIPSNQLEVCVKPNQGQCPTEHGRTIVGSGAGDELEDTAGWDEIRARGGADLISIEAGGRDEVACGGGEDTVLVSVGDEDDEIAGNCEEVEERAP